MEQNCPHCGETTNEANASILISLEDWPLVFSVICLLAVFGNWLGLNTDILCLLVGLAVFPIIAVVRRKFICRRCAIQFEAREAQDL